MGRNRPLVLAVIGRTFAGCCCVVECAGAVPVLLSMYYAILEESNKRLNASDSAALRRAFAVRLDCLNADLERGWIVLMVARSNRQRSDRQRKWLSALYSSVIAKEFVPRALTSPFYLLPTSRSLSQSHPRGCHCFRIRPTVAVNKPAQKRLSRRLAPLQALHPPFNNAAHIRRHHVIPRQS